jgi:HK97 family phage prohead protease
MTQIKTMIHPKIQELKLRSKPYSTYGPGIGFVKPEVLAELEKRAAKRRDDGQETAYFALWGVRNDRGEGVMKGAFTKSIKERGPKSKAKQKIVVVYQHDITDPIGLPTEIVEDDLGAYVVYEYADEDAVPSAKRAKSLIAQGILNGWSFGFDYVWDKGEYDEKTDTIWWKEMELFEISPVTFGAEKGTFTVRSKGEYQSAKLRLDDETEIALTGLPRNKQLEIRQLLTKHITLAKIEPDKLTDVKSKPLNKRKPKVSLMGALNKQLTEN